jgi:hypothetical protein
MPPQMLAVAAVHCLPAAVMPGCCTDRLTSFSWSEYSVRISPSEHEKRIEAILEILMQLPEEVVEEFLEQCALELVQMDITPWSESAHDEQTGGDSGLT